MPGHPHMDLQGDLLPISPGNISQLKNSCNNYQRTGLIREIIGISCLRWCIPVLLSVYNKNLNVNYYYYPKEREYVPDQSRTPSRNLSIPVTDIQMKTV
jgi:hypothetical protein